MTTSTPTDVAKAVQLKPVVIGLTGRRRVGKDTWASYLNTNYGFVQMTLAGPLKEIAKIIFGFSDAQLNDNVLKEEIDPRWGISPREALQFIGTELFRNAFGAKFPHIGATLWVRNLAERIAAEIRNPTYRALAVAQAPAAHGATTTNTPLMARIVVSDVRFPNEAQVIKDAGGVVIRIVRPCLRGVRDLVVDSHASETNSDSIVADYEINNDGTMEQFYERIVATTEKIMPAYHAPL